MSSIVEATAGDAIVRHELSHEGDFVRLAQITDSHLEEKSGGTLLGMDTDGSLAHVLDLLRSAALAPHVILATGDLANHGSREAYARFRQQLEPLNAPWYWLPGNHDDVALMREGFSPGAHMTRSVCIGGWQIILLDSTIPGKVGGRLGSAELNLLEILLREKPRHHALVCLHHQPVPIGCAWLDEQKVQDGAEFLALLKQFPQVRAVLWGHVHQEYHDRAGEVQLIATPSSCIQFAPMSASFQLDDKAPGMRWLDLYPDGRLETRVERVNGITFTVDRDSQGYQ